jgi:hypothetical protein
MKMRDCQNEITQSKPAAYDKKIWTTLERVNKCKLLICNAPKQVFDERKNPERVVDI